MELRFLHLSDLHFKTRSRDPAAALGQDQVNSALLKALTELASRPDFIVVTGDIAFSAQREEYELAEHFFERVLAAVGLPKERLFLVPGNHDVDRDKVSDIQVKRMYPFDTQEELTALLADQTFFPSLMEKFAPYRDFAFRATGRQLLNETTYHWNDTLRIDKGGRELRIRLLGLNSALMAGYNGDDQKKLAFGIEQVRDALGDGTADVDLSIGLHHHPFDCFHHCDEPQRNKLKNGLDMILSGHFHEGMGAASQDAAGTSTLLAAGACFERREHDNGFNEVRIDLTSGNGEVTFYKYLPKFDLWKETNERHPHEKDGRFHFILTKIADAPWEARPEQIDEPVTPPPTPAEPVTTEPRRHLVHDYLLPDKFAGRVAERGRLLSLAQGEPDPESGKRPGVICLRAPGGVGKSCLARMHLEEVSQSGYYPALLWFSFYEARTEDPAQFFREALTRLAPERLVETATAAQLGQALRNHLDDTPVLLFLDGLEVIQRTEEPNAPDYGRIKGEFEEVDRLLRHLCNQGCSRAVVTSRVPLSQLRAAAGHLELALDTLSESEGVELLRGLDVPGSEEALRNCVRLTGGHALALRAAGRWLAERRIDAENIEKLVGDPERFRATSEGEKVARIVDAYRGQLTPEQERFLRLMAIHPRAVTARNFPLLVEGYSEGERDALWVADRITHPLEQSGLLDVLTEGDEPAYHAHPLMKLAFSRWFDGNGGERAHREWARVALASPDAPISADQANSLAELQPLLDAVEHYLAVGAWREAWGIYDGRGLNHRLLELGQLSRLLGLGRRFETALQAGDWPATVRKRMRLHQYFGLAAHALNRLEESLGYNEKQYAAACDTDDSILQLIEGALLADAHANLGRVASAREQLGTLVPLAAELNNPYDKMVLYATQAKAALFAGEYAAALPLNNHALQHVSAYNKAVLLCVKSEIFTRLDSRKAARSALDLTLAETEKHHFNSLLPEILKVCILLALKEGNLTSARDFEARREAVHNGLEQEPFQPFRFLLCAEGHFDRAIAQETPYLSTPHDDKPNKLREIAALIALAQARLGKGEPERAEAHLKAARELMGRTGCWREQDVLEATEAMLAEGRSPCLLPDPPTAD